MKLPNYIQNSGIVGKPIQYKWESYLEMDLVEKRPRNLQKVVQGISCKATFTLDLGIAEWLFWRLNGLSNYQQINKYIHAMWAATIDRRYLKEKVLPIPDDQSDPANGPLMGLESELFATTMDAITNHPERSKSTSGLVSFVRYILDDTRAFDDWLKLTLSRFGNEFPYNPEEPQGIIVPRAFLDPSVELFKGNISTLLDGQLQEIDYSKNPFLMSPEELKASGFEGEPYRYLS